MRNPGILSGFFYFHTLAIKLNTMQDNRRQAMSVVVGLLSSMIILTLLEFFNSKIFPFPADVDQKDPLAIKAAITAMPIGAKLLQILSYFISALVGGMVATKFVKSESKNPALIVGGILTFLGLVNTVLMGEEIWMTVLTLLIYIPGAYLGYKIVSGKQIAS